MLLYKNIRQKHLSWMKNDWQTGFYLAHWRLVYHTDLTLIQYVHYFSVMVKVIMNLYLKFMFFVSHSVLHYFHFKLYPTITFFYIYHSGHRWASIWNSVHILHTCTCTLSFLYKCTHHNTFEAYTHWGMSWNKCRW